MTKPDHFLTAEPSARASIVIPRDLTPAALRALKILLEERSVTRAARRLNLTPSAVSRILSRLRRVFSDPLLVYVGGTFQPTEYGRVLESHLAAVVGQFERLLRPVATNPSEFRNRVRLGVSLYAADPDIERMVFTMVQEAPSIAFQLQHLPATGVEELETGALDLAISLVRTEAASLYATLLDADEWVCVMRARHPLATAMTAAAYFDARHLTMGQADDLHEPVDEALGNGRRQISWRALSDSGAAMALANSDLLLTVPRWIARPLLQLGPLVAAPLTDLSLPPARSNLFWHARVHQAPSHKWVRQRLLEMLRPSRKRP